VIDEVYVYYFDYEIADMTEEEKSQMIYAFKTSLYEDLTIVLSEVFENKMFAWGQ
jgi:hypothetical protein